MSERKRIGKNNAHRTTKLWTHSMKQQPDLKGGARGVAKGGGALANSPSKFPTPLLARPSVHMITFTEKSTHRQSNRCTDKQTDAQTIKQTDNQTDTQTIKQTHRHRIRHRQSNRHTDRNQIGKVSPLTLAHGKPR